MGRPHKGDRQLLQTNPYDHVIELLEHRRRVAKVSCMSQYIADVLAIHVGRPQLVVELGVHHSLPLTADPPPVSGTAPVRGHQLQSRPHRLVWEDVHRLKGETGVKSINRYVADVLALHVGLPHLVVELGRKDELPTGELLPLAM